MAFDEVDVRRCPLLRGLSSDTFFFGRAIPSRIMRGRSSCARLAAGCYTAEVEVDVSRAMHARMNRPRIAPVGCCRSALATLACSFPGRVTEALPTSMPEVNNSSTCYT